MVNTKLQIKKLIAKTEWLTPNINKKTQQARRSRGYQAEALGSHLVEAEGWEPRFAVSWKPRSVVGMRWAGNVEKKRKL